MIAAALPLAERRTWTAAGAMALAAHAAALALVLGLSRPAEPPMPEPVVLVELPPQAEAPPQAVAAAEPVAQPRPVAPAQPATPPIDVPPARVPLVREAITLPPPAPVRPSAPAAAPAPAQTPAQAAPAQPSAAPASAPAAGDDPRARRQEADYFALVSAHLNRRKVYPVEARQARQQGVVTVRFTVDRNGNVSNASIRRSSGHAVLDEATLALLLRVAPLPRMPGSVRRDSVTLSLPIDYSLRTS